MDAHVVVEGLVFKLIHDVRVFHDELFPECLDYEECSYLCSSDVFVIALSVKGKFKSANTASWATLKFEI